LPLPDPEDPLVPDEPLPLPDPEDPLCPLPDLEPDPLESGW
jgi:hypothetical protein